MKVVNTLLGPMAQGTCDLCTKEARCLWPHMQPPVRACEDHYEQLDPWRRRHRLALLRVLIARRDASTAR